MSRYGHNSFGGDSEAFWIFAGALAAVVVFCIAALTGAVDIVKTREVVGRVVETPVGRYVRSDTSGQEKFAVKLAPYEADEVVESTAGGAGSLIVECWSTRCAVMAPGECHRLVCVRDRRLFEPNVIECLHDREVPCPDGWTK